MKMDFEYGPALPTADRAITFKQTLKAIAQNHGLHATFMPKPLEGINGSGMHVHQSLGYIDASKGKNAFVDERDPAGLSDLARHFIAGQLKHARALSAVVAPLVNSYHRLVPGFEAPVYVAWAHSNRTALIRVPAIRQGNTGATRIELRFPDPACNPYLAMAAMLAAGMDGITHKLPLEAPVEENLYHLSAEELQDRNIPMLPASLGEAIEAFREDEVLRDALGEHTSQRLIEHQTAEWDAYRLHVSQWERDRYLYLY